MQITIGYLGPTGTYSEAVCQYLYPREKYSWQYIEYPDLLDLMAAIKNAAISLALIPIQNSKTGLLKDSHGHEFFSHLVPEKINLMIVAEKFWPLKYMLMANPGSKIDNIDTVHVNPYTQEQCCDYLSRHVNWKIIKHSSSSAAAKAVKYLALKNHVALAAEAAAKAYKLQILDDQIFDLGAEPIMHFLVLASENLFEIDLLKFELISSFVIGATAANIMSCQDLHTKISMLRKSADIPGYYYLDLYGSWSKLQLQEVFPRQTFIKWLGTYAACPDRHLYEKMFNLL